MSSDTKPALRPEVADAIKGMRRSNLSLPHPEAADARVDLVRAELERLAAENASLRAIERARLDALAESKEEYDKLAAENAVLKFADELHNASRVVEQWPVWKQTALGGKPSELAVLREENAALKAKGCPQCGVAAADMVTDNYCAACRVEELKADNGWWAGKCEQLQSAVAVLRSQLSRIDYAFGEPNEMWCSPYDVDLDGERVVRQVEAILKGEAKGGG